MTEEKRPAAGCPLPAPHDDHDCEAMAAAALEGWEEGQRRRADEKQCGANLPARDAEGKLVWVRCALPKGHPGDVDPAWGQRARGGHALPEEYTGRGGLRDGDLVMSTEPLGKVLDDELLKAGAEPAPPPEDPILFAVERGDNEAELRARTNHPVSGTEPNPEVLDHALTFTAWDRYERWPAVIVLDRADARGLRDALDTWLLQTSSGGLLPPPCGATIVLGGETLTCGRQPGHMPDSHLTGDMLWSQGAADGLRAGTIDVVPGAVSPELLRSRSSRFGLPAASVLLVPRPDGAEPHAEDCPTRMLGNFCDCPIMAVKG